MEKVELGSSNSLVSQDPSSTQNELMANAAVDPIIVLNYIADPAYAPYCMRCRALTRMRLVEPFLWQHDCGAVHDERQVLAHKQRPSPEPSALRKALIAIRDQTEAPPTQMAEREAVHFAYRTAVQALKDEGASQPPSAGTTRFKVSMDNMDGFFISDAENEFSRITQVIDDADQINKLCARLNLTPSQPPCARCTELEAALTPQRDESLLEWSERARMVRRSLTKEGGL